MKLTTWVNSSDIYAQDFVLLLLILRLREIFGIHPVHMGIIFLEFWNSVISHPRPA